MDVLQDKGLTLLRHFYPPTYLIAFKDLKMLLDEPFSAGKYQLPGSSSSNLITPPSYLPYLH